MDTQRHAAVLVELEKACRQCPECMARRGFQAWRSPRAWEAGWGVPSGPAPLATASDMSVTLTRTTDPDARDLARMARHNVYRRKTPMPWFLGVGPTRGIALIEIDGLKVAEFDRIRAGQRPYSRESCRFH
jgi:hypothetical protein